MKKQFDGCKSTAIETVIVHRRDRRDRGGTFLGSSRSLRSILRPPNAYRKRKAMSSREARMTRGFYFIHPSDLARRRGLPQ